MTATPDAPLAGAPLGRLLVATDLSQAARVAVDRAALLPLSPDATVEIVHVAPDAAALRRAGGQLAGIRDAVRDEARRLATRLARRGRPHATVSTVVTSGSPFAEILRRAELVRPDLLVLGRHGGGLKALLLGSTAERVLRGKAAPLLVVARPAAHPYSRPAMALDTTAQFLPIVRFALRVLPAELKRLELLSTFDILLEGSMRAAGVTTHAIREIRERQAKECRKVLERRLTRTIPAGTRVVTRIKLGDPRFVLPKLAEQHAYDLMVLGTHARRGLARFLLGSVAIELLRTSRGDALVIPPSAGSA